MIVSLAGQAGQGCAAAGRYTRGTHGAHTRPLKKHTFLPEAVRFPQKQHRRPDTEGELAPGSLRIPVATSLESLTD